MAITLSKADWEQARASLERYVRESFPEGMPVDGEGRAKLGQLGADGLLGFLLDEIGPLIYNQAVADVQERLLARVQEVDIEVHEEAFTYWMRFDNAQAGRRRRNR